MYVLQQVNVQPAAQRIEGHSSTCTCLLMASTAEKLSELPPRFLFSDSSSPFSLPCPDPARRPTPTSAVASACTPTPTPTAACLRLPRRSGALPAPAPRQGQGAAAGEVVLLLRGEGCEPPRWVNLQQIDRAHSYQVFNLNCSNKLQYSWRKWRAQRAL